MDVIESLPVLTPAGVATDKEQHFVAPPRTQVVKVHGLVGRSPSGSPNWMGHWLPPDSNHEFKLFSFKPSNIVGREAGEKALEIEARNLLKSKNFGSKLSRSYVWWAEDIGGVIVMLALVIATREARYRSILEKTQSIVFFGTPHRASSTYSLDAAVLAMIEACYSDLLGDWLPATVNRLSRQIEDVHEKFSLISHQFGIISHYQTPSSLIPYRLIITKDCASLGLENEITIGCNRPHKDMAKLMSRQEQCMLQVHMINFKIADWGRYKSFLGVLESTYPTRELEEPIWSLPRSTKVMSACSRHSKLANWAEADNPPRFLKVTLRCTVNPSKLLNSMAWAMWNYSNSLWAACPLVDLRHTDGRGPRQSCSIYAGLLQQILTQQPRAFLHMQHLVSLLTDAIRGRMDSWRERALWLCLRTVILASLKVPVYGFLHVRSTESVHILQQIHLALRGTESMFRLVIASAEGVLVDGRDDSSYVDLEFKAEDLEDCYLVDSDITPEALINPPVQQGKSSTVSVLETATHVTTTNNISTQLLTLSIQMQDRPVFIALVWIAFATRPLSMDELDLFLAFDESANSRGPTSLAGFSRGFASRLPKLLPEVVSIKLGRLYFRVPYNEIRLVVSQLSPKYNLPTPSPHLYLAQSCLAMLVCHVLNAAENERNSDESEDPDSQDDSSSGDSDDSSDTESDQEETEQPRTDPAEASTIDEFPLAQDQAQSSNKAEHLQQWAADRLSGCQRILAEYTIGNWFAHYRLASASGDPGLDESYSVFIKDEITVKNWLTLVEDLASLPSRNPGPSVSDELESLQRHLDITKIKDLEILYSLASRPSSMPGLGRLLVHAAEFENEALIHSLSMELGLISREALVRALAATSGSMHDRLWESAAPFLEQQHPRSLARVQLTAHLLGNDVVSRKLRAQLLPLATSPDLDGWLSEALQQAVEYCDSEVIEELLNCNDVKRCMENEHSSHRWTAIHRAACHGSLPVMTRLLEAGLIHAVRIASPAHRSPLYIASAYGFPDVVQYLLTKGADADHVNGSLKQTPLHAASYFGHWRTAKILRDHANITIVDAEGNLSLHTAIEQGHTRIAELLIERFPDVPAASHTTDFDSADTRTLQRPEKRISGGDRSKDEDATVDSEIESIFRQVEEVDEREESLIPEDTAPLNRVNHSGVTALFAAADRDLPTVGKRLLERGADPNILGTLSRVALHMAAKYGSVSLIEDLLDKGSMTGHVLETVRNATPLHYACYRGHVDAVEALAAKSDLASKEDWAGTPLSAACAEGHLQVVKSLVKHYDRQDLAPGLISAARYGHHDVASYLLDMGCPVDGKDPNGKTAFFYATTSSHSRIAQLLSLKGTHPIAARPENEEITFEVVCTGSYETVRLLIDTGMQIEAEIKDGFTPLTLAIYFERVTIVRLLLDMGAKLRLPRRWNHYEGLLEFSWGLSRRPITELLLDFYPQGNHEDGMTADKALVVAMKRRSKTLLHLVLEKWFSSAHAAADTSAVETLHYAVSHGHKNYLKAILQNSTARASINEQHPVSGTPLHSAIGALSNSSRMVDLLLQNGANVEIAAGRFGTTLNAACAMGKLDIAKKLLEILPHAVVNSQTGIYKTSIQSAVVGFRREPEAAIELLNLLVAHGCSVDKKGGLYYTALHAAVWLSAPKVVAWLTEQAGLLTVSRDRTGRLPLHLAFTRGDWDIVDGLIKSLGSLLRRENIGVRPMLGFPDNQGRSGLHCAAVSPVGTLMAKLLSQYDDEHERQDAVDLKDDDGWAPLHWACRQPNIEIVDALLAHGADPTALTKESWTARHIAVLHGNHSKEYLQALPDIRERDEELPDGEGTRFDRCCDVCLVRLYWKYYHCTNEECYDDFDLCFKCYRHANDIHDDSHEFECVTVIGTRGSFD